MHILKIVVDILCGVFQAAGAIFIGGIIGVHVDKWRKKRVITGMPPYFLGQMRVNRMAKMIEEDTEIKFLDAELKRQNMKATVNVDVTVFPQGSEEPVGPPVEDTKFLKDLGISD